jgi:hypothetical protein
MEDTVGTYKDLMIKREDAVRLMDGQDEFSFAYRELEQLVTESDFIAYYDNDNLPLYVLVAKLQGYTTSDWQYYILEDLITDREEREEY